jgi:molybdate/tungstate transport system substrate-binding protein
MRRRTMLLAAPLLLSASRPAAAEGVLRVAYAGSMGVVMDRALGPRFAAADRVAYQGTGHGSYALARLLAGRQMQTDVFVAITPGPMQVLQQAGLVHEAVPIASTRMVIAYSPRSRFAAGLKAAAEGHGAWWHVLQTDGFRFGRTDPTTDPQGQAIIFTMELAERYYRVPGLAHAVLGPILNPSQIFTEPSLLSRLEGGQIDASSGYESAVRSHRLPYVPLPDEINLGDPAFEAAWYSHAELTLPQPHGKAQLVRPQPLVFYAAVPANAPDPEMGRRFVGLLTSAEGQDLLRRGGYAPARGGKLSV